MSQRTASTLRNGKTDHKLHRGGRWREYAGHAKDFTMFVLEAGRSWGNSNHGIGA